MIDDVPQYLQKKGLKSYIRIDFVQSLSVYVLICVNQQIDYLSLEVPRLFFIEFVENFVLFVEITHKVDHFDLLASSFEDVIHHTIFEMNLIMRTDLVISLIEM